LDPTKEEPVRDLLNWTVSGLNITGVAFNEATSQFMFIEPSQKIKFYFTQVNFTLDFYSHFRLNHHLLGATETSRVKVTFSFSSITMFIKLTVDPKTRGLLLVLDQLSVNAEGKDLNFFISEGKGLFIHQVRNMFNTYKDYVLKNMPTLLMNFKDVL
jgi:hypothetical protein